MAINIPTSVTGNLTGDPEAGTTPNGTQYVRFGIAENKDRFNKATGAWEKDTTYFHRATMWGASAENFLASGIGKGDPVVASGDLQLVSWTDDEGRHRQGTELRVSSIGRDVTLGQRPDAGVDSGIETGVAADQSVAAQSPQAQAAYQSWGNPQQHQQQAGFQPNGPAMGM